jgi:cobalt-zinc-cadmium resistance protein CzcA
MVFEASSETRRAIIYGQLIIMVVYLPILTLTGVEGKMFGPMAFTVLAALLGAMIFSVTFIPAAVATFMGGKIAEKENILVVASKKLYRPSLNTAMKFKLPVALSALFLCIICGVLASKMGREFIPSLNEGDMAVQALRIPGTSLTQSLEMQRTLEQSLKALPEVQTVFARIGTAEIASDPMPPSIADTYVMLKPHEEWPNPEKTKDEFVAEVQEMVEKLPGNNYEITQPIQMRFNELIAGVRSDVAVKLYGDDLDVLLATAQEVGEVMETVPGSADVKVEQVTGLPMLSITPNRKAIARLGLNVADVQEVIEVAVGGKSAGEVFEGDRRFDLVVRLPEELRSDIEALKRVPVPLPAGTVGDYESNLTENADPSSAAGYVSLETVADFNIAPGPNQISRENGKRRIVVTANVRGRDIGSFVGEAEAKIKAGVKIPAGYWTDWGGQFEQLISAAQRLRIVVPLSFLMIFVLLLMMFGSAKDAILVFTGVPLALTGGIIALWIRDIPLSISAGVGFIALSGVAVLNGLVMISFIQKLREDGIGIDQAISQGAITRLRPVLMTALVASLGFVPMAIATGTGAEVQRPLATVVIGGIISSTLLTLVVLPVLYRIVYASSASVVEPAPKGIS